MSPSTSRRRGKEPTPPIELELRLGQWGARGAVQAEHDGRLIQIDRGLPGELVTATVDRRRRPWRGVVDAVLEADASRIQPPCPYFMGGCGGCQWQHIDYAAQVEIKRESVERELHNAGVDHVVDRIHVMDEPWRYRHTAAIAIGWEAGFRPRGRRGIIEIHDCPIAHPLIGHLADRVNDLLRAGTLPNYHGKVWLDCTVVGTEAEPTLQVLLQGISGLTLDGYPELPDVSTCIAQVRGVRSVAYRHRTGEVEPLVGDLMSTIEVDGRPMWLPAGSFFQANLHMLAALTTRIRGVFDGRTVRHAADVYGGVGTFGLVLADRVETMTLIELDGMAIQAARRTAAEWGLQQMSFVSRHAEKALPDLPALDLAIVDPPRSGLGEVVTDALVANGVPMVVYVSCAPASLARDLAALTSQGYTLRTLEMFDFYPQTYHVESLAILER